MYLYDFFSLLLGVQSAPKVGPTRYETACIILGFMILEQAFLVSTAGVSNDIQTKPIDNSNSVPFDRLLVKSQGPNEWTCQLANDT